MMMCCSLLAPDMYLPYMYTLEYLDLRRSMHSTPLWRPTLKTCSHISVSSNAALLAPLLSAYNSPSSTYMLHHAFTLG